MRAKKGEQEFAQFLLDLGSNALPIREHAPYNGCIQIPSICITNESLFDLIFPLGIVQEEMYNRVILTPTNKSLLILNDSILRKMPGRAEECISVGSVAVDDDIEDDTYPVDFLHSLTPSGLPPHILHLKIGCVVMAHVLL